MPKCGRKSIENFMTEELGTQVSRIYERAQNETFGTNSVPAGGEDSHYGPRVDECNPTGRVLAAL